jgi:alpha-beta hydrolase superfamily lysophospholipase
MPAGAMALFFRDWIVKLVAPKSSIAYSRRAAKAFPSTCTSRIFLTTPRLTVEAQLAVPDRATTALVLICHGIGERFYFWREVQQILATSGIASLVFHYPGYGRSTGLFTLENIDAGAQAAYAHLRGLAPEAPIFIFGTSLGTAVAAHLAAKLHRDPHGLILAQGFTTLREAATAVLRAVHLPPALYRLLPDVWRNTAALAATQCPVLIVHGASDQLFPVAMAEELFRCAQTRLDGKQSLLMPAGFDHSDPMLGRSVEAYWQPILDFIRTNAQEIPAQR